MRTVPTEEKLCELECDNTFLQLLICRIVSLKRVDVEASPMGCGTLSCFGPSSIVYFQYDAV